MNELKSRLRGGALGLALCAAVLPAHAGDPPASAKGSKEADAGVVAGFAVGALAGGPFGAVLGAGIGATLGDRYHRQAQSKAALTQELKSSEAQREQLEQSVAQLDSSLSQSQARAAELDATLERTDELGLDVSFRTSDDAVAAPAMSPLLKFGALVASLPRARVRIAGFADPRGSDAYNDELSLRRAQNVAAVLTQAGVPRERMLLEAHGRAESSAAAGDLDAYALDRRVTVRLELANEPEVAQRD